MHIQRFLILTALMIFLLSAGSARTEAAGQVRLELVGDARGMALSFQDWGQTLDGAGIKNVRLRTGTETDKVSIEIQGTADRPLYIVTGRVVSGDELLLPGARFKRGEVKRLAQWLDDLAQNGPPDKRPKLVAFGLTALQLEQVKKDLAAPVSFSTKGMSCREAAEKITRIISFAVKFENDFKESLGDDKVEDELNGLSCGTTLAFLLRPAGYCLVPQAAGNQIKYAVLKAQPNIKEFWPVGRKPESPLPEVLPGLFEFLNVNVQDVSTATVLETIGKRLKTPVLYDRAALAKYKIDPAKAMVSFPRTRTNYSMALGTMLFRAGLQFEVRTDEAGTAFLWVTTVKPM
jgi:hypothetical protein